MARRRSRKRKSSAAAKTVFGIFLIATVMIVFGTLAFWAFKESRKPGYDSVSLCPENGPVGHLAILLDTTDQISLTQLQAARQQLEKKIHEVPAGTRVSFSTVSPDSYVRTSSFYSLCKPASGEGASYFTENPRLIQARYEDEFLGPVQEKLSSVLSVEKSPSSPVMENLQEFITTIPGFLTAEVPRELVIMSDLIQHTQNHSFYRGLDWDSFRSGGGTTRLARNFSGATVTVLRIPRSVTSVEVIDDFWVRYFDAQGFTRVNVSVIGDL